MRKWESIGSARIESVVLVSCLILAVIMLGPVCCIGGALQPACGALRAHVLRCKEARAELVMQASERGLSGCVPEGWHYLIPEGSPQPPEPSAAMRDALRRLADDLASWADDSPPTALLKELKRHPVREWSPDERRELRAFLKERAGSLDIIAEIASTGGPIQAPYVLTNPIQISNYDCASGDLAIIASASIGLAVLAVADAEARNDHALALRCLGSGVDCLRALGAGDSPEGKRQALFSTMCLVLFLDDCFPGGALKKEDLQALDSLLSGLYHRETLTDILLCESLMCLAYADSHISDSVLGESTPIGEPHWLRDAMDKNLVILSFGGLADALVWVCDESRSEPFHLSDIKERYLAKLPSRKGLRAALRDQAELLANTLALYAAHVCSVDITRLGLAIERFHADTGHYPDDLSPLAATLGGGVTMDPFTGKSYRYQPRTDTFLLYSAGRNGEDDGANPDSDDIVWRRW